MTSYEKALRLFRYGSRLEQLARHIQPFELWCPPSASASPPNAIVGFLSSCGGRISIVIGRINTDAEDACDISLDNIALFNASAKTVPLRPAWSFECTLSRRPRAPANPILALAYRP